MRYGCYKPRAPFLLAGGVVAGAVGRLLVASYRFSGILGPLLLAAMGRAVSLTSIAAGADGHQPAAPRTVEHPVALIDGSTSCQKELDAKATVADTQVRCCGVALAMTQKPRPSLNGLGFTILGIGLVLPKESVAGHISVGHAGVGWSGRMMAFGSLLGTTKPTPNLASTAHIDENQIHAFAFRRSDLTVLKTVLMCLWWSFRKNQLPEAFASKRTRSTPLRARGRRESDPEENQIHQACAGGENHIQRSRATKTKSPATP